MSVKFLDAIHESLYNHVIEHYPGVIDYDKNFVIPVRNADFTINREESRECAIIDSCVAHTIVEHVINGQQMPEHGPLNAYILVEDIYYRQKIREAAKKQLLSDKRALRRRKKMTLIKGGKED
jgi:hypothetical protein